MLFSHPEAVRGNDTAEVMSIGDGKRGFEVPPFMAFDAANTSIQVSLCTFLYVAGNVGKDNRGRII